MLYLIVETFKQFDNDSLQDFTDYYHFMEENGISKKEIAEAIKISNDYPIIKEEYHDITEQFNDFQRQRNFYLSDNKILKYKNCEPNNEYNLLVSKIELAYRMLQLTENKLDKKIDRLESIKNS